MSEWTFFTNHAHVLLCISRDPTIRIRDLADMVGITERGAQRIIAELAGQGYLEVIREGRRNQYRVRADLPLRHPVEQPHLVGEVLQVLAAPAPRAPDDSVAAREAGSSGRRPAEPDVAAGADPADSVSAAGGRGQ